MHHIKINKKSYGEIAPQASYTPKIEQATVWNAKLTEPGANKIPGKWGFYDKKCQQIKFIWRSLLPFLPSEFLISRCKLCTHTAPFTPTKSEGLKGPGSCGKSTLCKLHDFQNSWSFFSSLTYCIIAFLACFQMFCWRGVVAGTWPYLGGRPNPENQTLFIPPRPSQLNERINYNHLLVFFFMAFWKPSEWFQDTEIKFLGGFKWKSQKIRADARKQFFWSVWWFEF